MDDNFYKAAIAHWQSERLKAIATLRMLFTKSVGIGEHTEILTEIHKWTDLLSQAEENINSLEKYKDKRI